MAEFVIKLADERGHIQEQTQTEEAIYKVLTTEQQQQLPVILANMKAKMAQHSST